MIKKIIIYSTLIILSGCGFTPMFKDFDSSNFNIQKINYFGDKDLVYLIKNYLNLEEKKDQKGLIVRLNIKENASSTKKNTSGIVTEKQITLTVGINIVNNQGKSLLKDSVVATRKLSVTNNLSSDDETLRTAKNNLMQNLTQKIKFKIQLISRMQK